MVAPAVPEAKTVLFRSVGNAPILRREKVAFRSDQPFIAVHTYLREQLALSSETALVPLFFCCSRLLDAAWMRFGLPDFVASPARCGRTAAAPPYCMLKQRYADIAKM